MLRKIVYFFWIFVIFAKIVFAYDAQLAIDYAHRWCNDGPSDNWGYNIYAYNSQVDANGGKLNKNYVVLNGVWHHETSGWFREESSDCANFVSQCLIAGGLDFHSYLNELATSGPNGSDDRKIN